MPTKRTWEQFTVLFEKFDTLFILGHTTVEKRIVWRCFHGNISWPLQVCLYVVNPFLMQEERLLYLWYMVTLELFGPHILEPGSWNSTQQSHSHRGNLLPPSPHLLFGSCSPHAVMEGVNVLPLKEPPGSPPPRLTRHPLLPLLISLGCDLE